MFACEKPVFVRGIDLAELTAEELPIRWKPVPGTNFHELKYSVKMPEGRTLLQRTRRVEQTVYYFSDADLPLIDRLQLLVEIMAHCNAIQSEPVSAQFSVIRSNTACEFGNVLSIIKSGELHLPSLK